MSRKIFLVIAGFAFLMCLVSAYFGSSIYNANDNIHVQHLNDMDRLQYYDAEEVPALSRLAAIISVPFLLAIAVMEIYVSLKTHVAAAKRIAFALCFIAIAVLILAGLTIKNPQNFDFSHWGFAWIIAGFFTVVGNAVSIFLRKKHS